jgi:aspartate/methionine/tyrosine aminotransferase
MERLPDFALEQYFAQWEFKARYHLTASDAQTITIGELLDLAGGDAREEFLALPLGYIPTWGTDALREAVAASYERAEPDDVLLFAGAEEAMFWVLQELLGPNDHAVVTVPNYQSMEAVPLATGAAVTGVPLWSGHGSGDSPGWRLDVDQVRDAMTDRTTVVAVNVPNNPTGYVPDQRTWAELVALCDQRGVHLFSDEVYRGVEADPTATLPAAVDLAERGISLDVTSKSLGLPGLRVGWLACRDRALLARLETRKHWTSICNAGPSELLALHAVRHREVLQGRIRALIAGNIPVFDAFFAEHPDLFDWQAPDGGCVAFPRYLGADGVDRFCAELVEQRGVLLLPGSVYASRLLDAPLDRFRIGVGRRDPGPALAELGAFLAGRRTPAATRR